MRYQVQEPDHFDDHRKDHTGRPILFVAALICSILVWGGVIAAVMAAL